RKAGSSPHATPAERMKPLWSKAQAASRSAQLLLENGDTDGAVNRAYYAVFGAARAALATVRLSLAKSKRHGTIYRRFETHLVQAGTQCSWPKAKCRKQAPWPCAQPRRNGALLAP